MKYLILVVGVVATLFSFSSLADVIIDPAGVDMDAYQKDLAECNELSEQVDSKTGAGAAKGAVRGTAVVAILGNNRNNRGRVAGISAISGAAKGSAQTKAERQQVVKNCLRGRGYKVLN